MKDGAPPPDDYQRGYEDALYQCEEWNDSDEHERSVQELTAQIEEYRTLRDAVRRNMSVNVVTPELANAMAALRRKDIAND